MTTNTMTQTFQAEDEITLVDAPLLQSTEDAQRLLEVINDVRTGRKFHRVRIINTKQTKSRKRLPPGDYTQDPSLIPGAHEGWITRANTNKQGEVYIYIKDEARRKEGETFGHTCVKPSGISFFKVLESAPGPLAVAEQQAEQPTEARPSRRELQAMLAHNLAAQAQAMWAMGLALYQQAIQLQQMLAQDNTNP